jgi:outer membrane immunogenic protein
MPVPAQSSIRFPGVPIPQHRFSESMLWNRHYFRCSTLGTDFMTKLSRALLCAASMTVIVGTQAVAADLAYKARPAVAPVAIYNWNGFYVGGHVGGGWGQVDNTSAAPGTGAFPTGTPFARNDTSGFLGGVQGGFNWQVNSLVLGIEGEYTWTDVKGTATSQSTQPRFLAITSTSTTKTDDIAMVTGRIGYAANNWLLYAKGGWAWADGGSNGVVTSAGVTTSLTSSSTDRDGWVVGAGAEWGFAPNWSAKLEYNHVDFGSKTVEVTHTPPPNSFTDSSSKIDIVKAGVNYRFNWSGPVVAKY